MDNIELNNFSQYYNTLQQAQQLLKDVEGQYNLLLTKQLGNSGSTLPDGSELKKFKDDLNELIDLLLSNQDFDNDLFSKKVDKVFVSILSTSDAYARVVDALLEVQKILEEEMRRYLAKLQQKHQDELLQEKMDTVREDLERVMAMLADLKEGKKIDVKRDFADIQNFLIHLRERYSIDVRAALNRVEFNKVV